MTSEEITKVKELFHKVVGWLNVFAWYGDIDKDFTEGLDQMYLNDPDISHLTAAEERSLEAYKWLKNNSDTWSIPDNAIAEFKRVFMYSKK